MPASDSDRRFLAAAAALAARGRPLSRPNPAVGALLVRDGRIVGRGWTQSGGRPHAEAVAIAEAGATARGATLYVTLEPCAHESARGPACSEVCEEAGIARAVIGCRDPDPRTAGLGIERLKTAGVEVDLVDDPASEASLAGYLSQRVSGRPHVTLKLAMSLDGRIALADGTSQWITGAEARAHTHALRARSDAICVGGETMRADEPRLDVRLAGLENRSPDRYVLTRGEAPEGWRKLATPEAIAELPDTQYLMVEGGAGAAAAFLRADLVDELALYTAPIVIGGDGLPAIGELGLTDLGGAHRRWGLREQRQLGSDTLAIYQRQREGDA